jgi:hypothetical protein
MHIQGFVQFAAECLKVLQTRDGPYDFRTVGPRLQLRLVQRRTGIKRNVKVLKGVRAKSHKMASRLVSKSCKNALRDMSRSPQNLLRQAMNDGTSNKDDVPLFVGPASQLKSAQVHVDEPDERLSRGSSKTLKVSKAKSPRG